MSYLILALFSYALGVTPSALLLNVRQGRLGRARLSRHYVPSSQRFTVTGLDFLKGVAATLIGLFVAGWGGACTAAVAVNAGGVFPPSVAATPGARTTGTAAGSLLILSPLLLLAGVVTFVLVLYFTQYLSLSTALSTVVVMILSFFIRPSWFILVVILLLGLGVLYLHRNSYARFMRGKEPVYPIRRWLR